MVEVNAMGDTCPIPVIKTKKAIEGLNGAGVVETLVDNEIAVQNLKKMADQALRVLMAAMAVYDTAPQQFLSETLERELCFLGLEGMIDPVRPEVKDAIRECNKAGIRPVMITGDRKSAV